MLCPHCQKEHPDSQKFCPFTGKPLLPPETAAPQSPEPVRNTCIACGKEIPKAARFCPFCQSEQKPAPAPLPQAELPAPPPPAARQPARRARIPAACCLVPTVIFLLVLVAPAVGFFFVDLRSYPSLPLPPAVLDLQQQAWSLIGKANIGEPEGEQPEETPQPETPPEQGEPQDEQSTPADAATLTPTVSFTPIITAVPTRTATPTKTRTATPTPSPTLTPTPTEPPSPIWQQGKLAFPMWTRDGHALYQLDLVELQSPELLYQPSSEVFLTAPFWSPDGSRIAFSYYLKGMNLIDAVPGAAPVSLYECDTPTWSPDGSQIICKTLGSASFTIFDMASNQSAQTLSQSPAARLPAWSPLGDEIAYVMVESGRTSLWRVGLNEGAQPVLLTGEASENYAPAWSPDGEWLAFQSNRDRDLSDVWIISRTGEGLRRVVFTPEGFWSRAPAWSPDGQWLAFVSNQAGSRGADYGEIFVVSLQTGEVYQVTSTGGLVYDWRVSWSR